MAYMLPQPPEMSWTWTEWRDKWGEGGKEIGEKGGLVGGEGRGGPGGEEGGKGRREKRGGEEGKGNRHTHLKFLGLQLPSQFLEDG